MATVSKREGGMGAHGVGAHVSQEEQDFIRGLFASNEPGSQTTALPRLLFEIPEAAPRLMEVLQTSGVLRLEADTEDCSLAFTARLTGVDMSNGARLELGHPEILDRSGPARSRRVANRADGIHVTDTSGHFHGMTVLDVSTSGIAVRAQTEGRLRRGESESLPLRIDIVGAGRYRCNCEIVRIEPEEGSNQRIGMRFGLLSKSAMEALAHYQFCTMFGE